MLSQPVSGLGGNGAPENATSSNLHAPVAILSETMRPVCRPKVRNSTGRVASLKSHALANETLAADTGTSTIQVPSCRTIQPEA